MVIHYSYLWHREAQAGQEEGRKDRPCAIVLATKDNRVVVAPITHQEPVAGSRAIEIPQQIKKTLGLDHERSWIVTNDVNYFTWPGSDLRPIDRKQPDKIAYGTLPPNFTKQVLVDVREQMQQRQVKTVSRDEPKPVSAGWKKTGEASEKPETPKSLAWSKKADRSPEPKKPPSPSRGRGRSR